ncbi:transposase [Larkinella sp. VNQ87]|uniref:transposase n=1 Tax=Larkinella sp. VNQ87 TaxID=3400921 RepID=UPI003C00C8D5
MKIEYRRNLPHLQYVGATFFITFCLKGSLPAEVVRRLVDERQAALRQIQQKPPTSDEIVNVHKRYFAKIDRILDQGTSGNRWLQNRSIAELLADKIKSYDGESYDLIAFCIMPNHVHLVVDSSVQLEKVSGLSQPDDQHYRQLFTVLQQIKGSTAYGANRMLNRTGAFWQPESYDHVVRNVQELKNIVNYTLQNPVQAGLVTDWRDWPFSFLNERIY